jgi:hypothetical protein
MSVKTGSAWAGSFVTLDSTGALSASADAAGVLYVDGVANAAAVTITGSNPYKWSVTLPSLTAGQRVDMYITGTIATIATAGFVASEQADTSLVSEVKTETAAILEDTGTTLDTLVKDIPTVSEFEARTLVAGSYFDPAADTVATVTNLTNLPAITANWLTGTGVDASAVTKLQANLALEATLTAIKGAGWDTQTLAAIDVLIDAIKAKTDVIPAAPAEAGEYTAAIAAIPTAPLLAANYVAPDNATIGTIAGNVDDLETRLTAARAGYLDKLNVSGTLAHSNDAATYKADVSGLATSTEVGAIALLGETVIGTYTVQDILTILAAKMVGKASGGGTTTIKYRGVDDTTDVVVETVDDNGNRSAVTLTV